MGKLNQVHVNVDQVSEICCNYVTEAFVSVILFTFMYFSVIFFTPYKMIVFIRYQYFTYARNFFKGDGGGGG